MEFTKDVMFHIKYEKDKNIIKINKELRNKKSFLEKIKKHKFFTGLCFSGFLIISADIILINNFINILKQF